MYIPLEENNLVGHLKREITLIFTFCVVLKICKFVQALRSVLLYHELFNMAGVGVGIIVYLLRYSSARGYTLPSISKYILAFHQ